MSNLEDKNNALEKDKARLIRRINALEEREKLNYLSHVDTVDQLLQGRQNLYDRLEECLEIGGEESQQEISNIITQLRIRTGSYGVERKNLVNNLFKSIIDLSFPNMVKYLFWACEDDKGIFELVNLEEVNKFKKQSKYVKQEFLQKGIEVLSDSISDKHSDIPNQTINHLLDINILQNEKMREEQDQIKVSKAKF